MKENTAHEELDVQQNIINGSSPGHYVVGIGASAGGLEAIQELFDNIPADNNISFIIVQHLSPDYKSLMAELLRKHTPMNVFEAEDGISVTPNCVYVIPSKKTMTIKNGKIKLTEKKVSNVPNNAIDLFFKSLAEEKGSKSIAVILSGTGTDGTKGVEAVKKSGGLVIVQDPVTAKFDGMPNSAIIAGHADFILSPELMPEEIFNYVKEFPVTKGFQEKISRHDELAFTEILTVIHQHTSCDFTLYKRPTITRRISRRMAAHGINKLGQYLDFLHQHPEEIDVLCKEFLIGVTRFFRDPETFELVRKKVIPSIIEPRKPKDQVKVWVTACSTGEEAYTLAILFREYLLSVNKDVNVKIFATDIDREAINFASGGIYAESISKDISPERLNEYFIKEGNKYVVHPEVRKMVIFAHHDITKDPPFSKMDMVSCRNMLIYMNPVLQKKILSIFVFSLNFGGYLLLGSSETPGESKHAFSEVSKKWKIYKNIATLKTLSPETLQSHAIRPFTRSGLPAPAAGKGASIGISEMFNDIIGEEFGYAGILIDETYELKQAVGDFNKYLSFPSKRLNFNLLKMVPEELSVALGTAVRRALKNNEKVMMRSIRIRDKKGTRLISMLVKPYSETNTHIPRHAFVILNDERTLSEHPVNEVFDKEVYDKERMQDMELELKETKENLQSAIEELETSNEELQSSNEELLSANEELQSTNEELQSLNEELHTVNSEHQLKIKELIELNDDLNNYFKSTNIGQLFVDRNLIIRKFTPAAVNQVNLIESDIGRPITHISSNIKYSGLIDDIQQVIESSEPIEKEVASSSNRWYLMRIIPYIRRDRKTDGVVITFVDITAVNELNTLLGGVLNSSLSGIMALKPVHEKGSITDFVCTIANDTVKKIVGGDNLEGKRLLEVWPSYEASGMFRKFANVIETGDTLHIKEFYSEGEDKRWYDVVAVRFSEGIVVTFTDVTDKRLADEKLRELNRGLETKIQERTRELAHTEERFRLVAKVTNDAVYDRNLVTNHTWWNEGFTTLFGYKNEENSMNEWYSRIHPEDLPRVQKKLKEAIAKDTEQWTDEYRILRSNGTHAYILDRGYLLQDESKKPVRMVGAIMDLTPLKEQENEQKRLIAIIENSTDFISFSSPEKKIIYLNPAGLTLTGLSSMDEAREKYIPDFFSVKDRKFFQEHILPELTQRGHWEGEFQMTNFKTNNSVLVHFNIFSITDDEGRITGYGTVTRDIRRELAFRRAITEGAERLRLMANAMPQKVWTATADGSADYFNEQWMKYSAKPINELMGEGWLKIIHSEDKKATIKLWKEVVNTGEFFQVEHRLKRADGIYRWHLTRALPHRDEQGEILGWVGSSTDIDEQKKQEEKKDEFIGIASHELKTPLTSLKAYTQLVEAVIKGNDPDMQKLQTYITKTGSYIDKLNALVSDLLDVSKIQSGKLTFDMQDVDFDAMVMETIEMLTHTNHHKLIIKGKTHKKVKGDKSRLEQVIENLISNAVKYSPKADKVKVELIVENDCVHFAVTDYGIGIPPDKLENIFNRFYRVEGMTHKFQGLGIGLYISSEIIKRHKGKIWADSIVGEGSTFHFTLPVADNT
jgi:two-component system CheB/CheR fusion protein